MEDLDTIQPLPLSRRIVNVDPQAQHFKSFKSLWKQKEATRVVDVSFRPVKPFKVAVVSGTKVALWQNGKGSSPELVANLSRFKDVTLCAAWRNDGKLMLAGETSGTCAVIEMQSNKVLRRFRDHGDAVTSAAFATADRSRAATGCRDGKLRIWDVVTSELLCVVEAHEDAIKTVQPGPGASDLWITAGSDSKIKLWDLALGGKAVASEGKVKKLEPLLVMEHGDPVEAGVVYPGGNLFVSAGGTQVKVWDMTNGSLVETLAEAHTKVVTRVALAKDATVLLTAGFDGFVKIWNAARYELLWSYKFSAPITAAAWRSDAKAFAIGMEDGSWQLRVWKSAAKEEEKAKVEAKPVGDDWKKRARVEGHLRGQDADPGSDDEIVVQEKKRARKSRDAKLDFFFKRFEYKKAIERIAKTRMSRLTVLGAFEELLQRGALQVALTEIGEELSLALLRWLRNSFKAVQPVQHPLLMEVLHTLLDFNKCLQPPCTEELMKEALYFEVQIARELNIQEVMLQTSGMLKAMTVMS